MESESDIWLRVLITPVYNDRTAYDSVTHTWATQHVAASWVVTASVSKRIKTPQSEGSGSDAIRLATRVANPSTVAITMIEPAQAQLDGDGGTSDPPTAPNPDVTRITYEFRSLGSAFQDIRESGPNPDLPLWEYSIPIARADTVEIRVSVEFRNRVIVEDTVQIAISDWLIVGMGDSYAAGQGNPNVPARFKILGSEDVVCRSAIIAGILEKYGEFRTWIDETLDKWVPVAGVLTPPAPFKGIDESLVSTKAAWQEAAAWRGRANAHALAVDLQSRYPPGGVTSFTFVSSAQSGAEIVKGLLEPQRSHISVGQVDEIANLLKDSADAGQARAVDALVLTIGGNDTGFAPQIETLTVPTRPTKVGLLVGLLSLGWVWIVSRTSADEVHEAVKIRLSELSRNLRIVHDAIEEKLHPRNVLLVEYPVALFDGDDKQPKSGCGVFGEHLWGLEGLGISKSDAQLIEEMGLELLSVLQERAAEFGWIYVDGIYSDFKGHGICSSDPWFVNPEQSCANQADFFGTLHPNAAGQAAISRRIAEKLTGALVSDAWPSRGQGRFSTGLIGGIAPPINAVRRFG